MIKQELGIGCPNREVIVNSYAFFHIHYMYL